MRFLWLFLIVSLFSLYADDSQEIIDMEQHASIIDFETIPSAIVGNAVNVINGHYVETETDYLSRSASLIHIQMVAAMTMLSAPVKAGKACRS